MMEMERSGQPQSITNVKAHGHEIKYVDKDHGYNYYRCKFCTTTFAEASYDNSYYRGRRVVLWYSETKDDYVKYDGFTCKDKIVRDILE